MDLELAPVDLVQEKLIRQHNALPVFKRVFEKDANWAVLTPRLVPVELLNVSEGDLEKILKQAP